VYNYIYYRNVDRNATEHEPTSSITNARTVEPEEKGNQGTIQPLRKGEPDDQKQFRNAIQKLSEPDLDQQCR